MKYEKSKNQLMTRNDQNVSGVDRGSAGVVSEVTQQELTPTVHSIKVALEVPLLANGRRSLPSSVEKFQYIRRVQIRAVSLKVFPRFS